MPLGCTTRRAQSPTHAHLGMAFCCGWQRFLPRQRQRSPYSKLIVNATGFSLLLFLPLHCTAFSPLGSCSCHRYCLGCWVPWKSSLGGRGTGHGPKRRGFLESPFYCQGDEKEGVRVSMSNHEDRVSHPCKALIVCTRSQGRTLLQLNVLCSPSAGGRGLCKMKEQRGFGVCFQSL